MTESVKFRKITKVITTNTDTAISDEHEKYNKITYKETGSMDRAIEMAKFSKMEGVDRQIGTSTAQAMKAISLAMLSPYSLIEWQCDSKLKTNLLGIKVRDLIAKMDLVGFVTTPTGLMYRPYGQAKREWVILKGRE